MALPVFYFMGGEDSGPTGKTGAGTLIDTTSGHFNSYNRCALSIFNDVSSTWQFHQVFSSALSTFWQKFVMWGQTAPFIQTFGKPIITWTDANNVQRLRIRATTYTGNFATDAFLVEKGNAAGTWTQLGSSTFTFNSATVTADIQINYAVIGSINIYLGANPTPAFTFSGDLTTDGNTTLQGFELSCHGLSNVAGNKYQMSFSEFPVSDTDTRAMTQQTVQPVANGNTHNFDTGTPAAANVNEVTLNDNTFDGSSVAGQIDQYTIPGQYSAALSILGFAVEARMEKGFTGPTKADLNIRSGGSDWFSSDQVLQTFWTSYRKIWNSDPATGGQFAALPANIGIKSVA